MLRPVAGHHADHDEEDHRLALGSYDRYQWHPQAHSKRTRHEQANIGKRPAATRSRGRRSTGRQVRALPPPPGAWASAIGVRPATTTATAPQPRRAEPAEPFPVPTR